MLIVRIDKKADTNFRRTNVCVLLGCKEKGLTTEVLGYSKAASETLLLKSRLTPHNSSFIVCYYTSSCLNVRSTGNHLLLF